MSKRPTFRDASDEVSQEHERMARLHEQERALRLKLEIENLTLRQGAYRAPAADGMVFALAWAALLISGLISGLVHVAGAG